MTTGETPQPSASASAPASSETPVLNAEKPKPTLSVLILNPAHKSVVEAVELFKKKFKEPVVIKDKPEEIRALLTEGTPAVVILSVLKENQLIDALGIVKAFRKIEGFQVRYLVISKVESQKLRNAFMGLGTSEFLGNRTSASAISVKTSILLSQLQGNSANRNDDNMKVSSSRKGGGDSGDSGIMVKGGAQTSSVVIAEDIWLIKGVAPRKVGVQWIVEAEGPDPDSGDWEFVGMNEKKQEEWAWKPRGLNGEKAPDTGAQEGWAFTGNKPVFDPDSGKWRMVAARPDLSHVDKKGKRQSKIQSDDNDGLIIAADNPKAAEKINESKKVGEIVKNKRDKETQARLEDKRKAEAKESQAKLTGGLDWDSDEDVGGDRTAGGAKEKSEDSIRQGKAGSKEARGDRKSGGSAFDDDDEESPEAGRSGGKGSDSKAARLRAKGNIASEDDDETENASRGEKTKDGKLASAKTSAWADDDDDDSALSSKGPTGSNRDSKNAKGQSSSNEDERVSTGSTRTKNSADAKSIRSKSGNAADDSDEDEIEQGKSSGDAGSKKSALSGAGAKSGTPSSFEERQAARALAAQKKSASGGWDDDGEDEAGEESSAPNAKSGKLKSNQVGAKGAKKGAEGTTNDEDELSPKSPGAKDSNDPRQKTAGGKTGAGKSEEASTRTNASEDAGDSGGASVNDWEDDRERKAVQFKDGGAEKLDELTHKNYMFKRTNGHLKAKKTDVPLDRVPSAEFGDEDGVWEKVENKGWIFMSLRMRTKGPDDIQKHNQIWTVDDDGGGLQPFYDAKTKTWLFSDGLTPKKATSIDQVSKEYQNFLFNSAKAKMNMQQAKEENAMKLNQEASLTAWTFDSFGDSPKGAQDEAKPAEAAVEAVKPAAKKANAPSHLGFFLKLSDMAVSKWTPDQTYGWITKYILDTIKAEQVHLLKTEAGSKMVTVLSSTSDKLPLGHRFDLGKTMFSSSLDIRENKVIALNEKQVAALVPLVRTIPSELRLGALIVQASKLKQDDLIANENFFEQLRKQLVRYLSLGADKSA